MQTEAITQYGGKYVVFGLLEIKFQPTKTYKANNVLDA